MYNCTYVTLRGIFDMKKKLAIIFLCITMALSLVGCSFVDGFKDGYNENKEVNETSTSNN